MARGLHVKTSLYPKGERVFAHPRPISDLHFSHVTKARKAHAVRARRQNGRLNQEPYDFSAFSRMDRKYRGKELMQLVARISLASTDTVILGCQAM